MKTKFDYIADHLFDVVLESNKERYMEMFKFVDGFSKNVLFVSNLIDGSIEEWSPYDGSQYAIKGSHREDIGMIRGETMRKYGLYTNDTGAGGHRSLNIEKDEVFKILKAYNDNDQGLELSQRYNPNQEKQYVEEHIDWARKHLKNDDRIIWFLRHLKYQMIGEVNWDKPEKLKRFRSQFFSDNMGK